MKNRIIIRSLVGLAGLCGLLRWGALPLRAQESSPRLAVQMGASTILNCAAFSRDGRFAVTAGNEIILWEATTGRELRRIGPGGARIHAVAFSPDARHLAGSDSNNLIRLWETATGEPVWQAPGGIQWAGSLAFTPDGRFVASGSGERAPLLLDARSGAVARRFVGHEAMVVCVDVSPDGRYLLTGSSDRTARLWEIASGKEVRRISDQPGRVRAVAFSADGRRILTSAYDNKAHLWETETFKEIAVLEADQEVWSVAFSPDGTRAVLGCNRGASLWDLGSGKRIREFAGMTETAYTVGYSADGQRVLAAGNSATGLVWEEATGNPSWSLAGQSSRVEALVYSADGRDLLVGTADGSVHLWDWTAGKQAGRLATFSSSISALAVSRDGKMIAASDRTGNLQAWTFPNRQSVRKLATGMRDITALELSAGSGYIVARSAGEARVWDLGTGRELGKYKTNNRVDSVAASPDGRWLATWGLQSTFARLDPFAHVFETSTGREVRQVGPNAGVVHSLAFSHDGRHFVTGAYNTPYRLWQSDTGRELQRYAGLSGEGGAIAFSPDDRLVAAASIGNLNQPGGVALWDVQSGKLRQRWPESSTWVTFSPDGRHLLTRTRTEQPQVIEIATGKLLYTLEKYAGTGDTVAISPDSRHLAAGRADNSLHLLDLPTGKDLCSLFSFKDGTWAVIDPAGRFDTNNVENLRAISWVMPDDPLRTLGSEMFIRDYFEPRLLTRLLANETFKPVRPLAGLNRAHARVTIVGIKPEPGAPDRVAITVELEPGEYRYERAGKPVVHRSEAYDLRLYRDGQLVAQFPDDPKAYLVEPKPGDLSEASLQKWQAARRIDLQKLARVGNRAQVTFRNIRVSRDPERPAVEFNAYAFNSDRVKGPTARRSFTASALAPAARRAYVITMGVSVANSNPGWDLWFGASGAKEIQAFLGETLARQNRYTLVPVTLLADYEKDGANLAEKSATKAALKQVLDYLAGRRRDPENKIAAATPDDLVIVCIVSHGYTLPGGGFYLVPLDLEAAADVSEKELTGVARAGGPRPAARDFLDRSISSEELTTWLREVDAGEMILILDSCHSADVAEREFKPGPLGDRGFGQLAYDKAMRVLAATQGTDTAMSTRALGHSLLTHALLRFPGESRSFDFKAWLAQAEERVPQLYQEQGLSGKPQRPALLDFAWRREGAPR